MSNPCGPGSTEAARTGSAMNDSARDMTIRTVAAVLCASLRSSDSDRARWSLRPLTCAPSATRTRFLLPRRHFPNVA